LYELRRIFVAWQGSTNRRAPAVRKVFDDKAARQKDKQGVQVIFFTVPNNRKAGFVYASKLQSGKYKGVVNTGAYGKGEGTKGGGR
jgi:hypothetical protein